MGVDGIVVIKPKKTSICKKEFWGPNSGFGTTTHSSAVFPTKILNIVESLIPDGNS